MTMIWKNDGNIPVPKYLNEEFFTKALEEGLRVYHVDIDEITVSWGCNPGDNYCSSIYRVIIKYNIWPEPSTECQQISLIVKTIPITKELQFLDDVGVFIKEKIIYNDVLPRLNILMEGNKFGAK